MRATSCPNIEGGALRLRPIAYSDIPDWYAYLRLPQVLEHTSWHLTSAEELQASVDGFDSDSPSSALGFAIESAVDSKFIGAIGFHSVSPVHRTAEIAFNLHPDYWGRGIATRCCTAVADWGFSEQRYLRIQGAALDSNLPSMRVFEKCGFIREGKMRNFRLVRGQPRDFWMFRESPMGQGESPDGNAVTAWFGEAFALLHPLLQALHRDGGRLTGSVSLQFGNGLGAILGRRLARKLGIPDVAGSHLLDVDIRHDAVALYWNRQFDQVHELRSVFRAIGKWPDGHWVEKTGPLELALRVEIDQGGWYWRPFHARLHGVTVPLRLLPRSTAYKRIEQGKYRFHVAFAVPVLGQLLSYSGLLDPSLAR